MPIKPEHLDELLAGYEKPEDLLGEDGLFKQLKKALLERALGAELTHHLGYEKGDPVGRGSDNHRNGSYPKTVLTEDGAVDLDVPRDRNGTFDPQIVPKGETRLDGFDDKIISMYARGMTVREIQGHLRELYAVDVSPDLISRVTDAVLEEVREWQNRPGVYRQAAAAYDFAMTTDPRSVFISAVDGLKLHARCYGSRSAGALPVVCLPGLARTEADFEPLARALAGDFDRPRRVIALDYRGRGLSEYDPDPTNYNFQIELADVLAVIAALDAARAVVVGTSRGGILAMLLAALRPTAIAGVVLNDIGPVIEPKGLIRIKGYVGKLPQPHSYEEAAEILRRLFDAQFPKLTRDDWLASAHRTFREGNGTLLPTYDVNLAKTLEGVEFDKPFPPLWAQFGALAQVPLMVIRGANSDILSRATVEAMQARHADMEAIEVPDQGHAPLLVEPEIIARIAAFVARCEA